MTTGKPVSVGVVLSPREVEVLAAIVQTFITGDHKAVITRKDEQLAEKAITKLIRGS